MPPMSSTTMALLAFAAIAGVLMGKKLFARDEAREDFKEQLIKLTNVLVGEGFKRLPRAFTKVAIGDVSGLVREVKAAVEDFQDPAQLSLELEGVLQRQIEKRAKDEATREQLYDRVEKLKLQYPPKAPTAVPAKPAAA